MHSRDSGNEIGNTRVMQRPLATSRPSFERQVTVTGGGREEASSGMDVDGLGGAAPAPLPPRGALPGRVHVAISCASAAYLTPPCLSTPLRPPPVRASPPQSRTRRGPQRMDRWASSWAAASIRVERTK